MGNDMGMRKEPVLWVISVTTPTQEVLSTGVSEYSALPVVWGSASGPATGVVLSELVGGEEALKSMKMVLKQCG